jgi:hypothetical protein
MCSFVCFVLFDLSCFACFVQFTVQVECGERPFFFALENAAQMFDWIQILRAVRGRLVEGKVREQRGCGVLLCCVVLCCVGWLFVLVVCVGCVVL